MKHVTPLFSSTAPAGLCIALFLTLCSPLLFRTTALGQSDFQEFITYPLGDTLAAFDFEPTPNGGFGSFTSWYNDRYFIRTDDSGLPTWAGTLHFDTPLLPIFGTLFRAMPDGGALIPGRDYSVYTQGGWVRPATSAARIDLDGQLLWSKRYVMADSVQTSSSPNFTYQTFPDGTTLATGFDDWSYPSVLFIMKLDQQGVPLWTSTVDVSSINGSLPTILTVRMPDGGCTILYGDLMFGTGYLLIRVDVNGDIAWAKNYEMTNANWEVVIYGMASDAVGNLAIGSTRYNTPLSYGDMLWLSPTGVPYRHRLDPDYTYAGAPLTWNDDGIWAGQRVMDSTGTSVIGGYSLIHPGTFSNTDHSFTLRDQSLLNNDLWLNGYYRVVDNTFGYQVNRPYLMRTPSMNITGCRLSALPPAPINYIDVPDSLLQVAALNLPWWQTTTSVADTAVVVQDRNPNSIYDLCAIVGVQEEVTPSVTANVWPDPLPQGALLNVDASGPTDLVIHDLGGRVALQLLDQRSTRQVSTSAFEPGTYIATGRDQHGARLWSRPFVVL